MYKVKRFGREQLTTQDVVNQKEFSTKSVKKVDLDEISRMVREDMKKHKIAYDILSK